MHSDRNKQTLGGNQGSEECLGGARFKHAFHGKRGADVVANILFTDIAP